jgi:hypothetical protein
MAPASSSDAAAAAPDRNIGRRVKVYWERDTTWYSGRVVSHTSRRGWRIEYDTVEGEDDLAAWHDLTEERHEWLDDGGVSVATPASSSAAAKKRPRAEPSKAAPSKAISKAAPSKAVSKAAQKRMAPSKATGEAVVVKDEDAEDEDLVEEVAPPSKGATAGSSTSATAVNDGGDDGDEDIVFMGQTGAVALADFPHVSSFIQANPDPNSSPNPTPSSYPFPCPEPGPRELRAAPMGQRLGADLVRELLLLRVRVRALGLGRGLGRGLGLALGCYCFVCECDSARPTHAPL